MLNSYKGKYLSKTVYTVKGMTAKKKKKFNQAFLSNKKRLA
jgi:hypothetical protein